MIQGKHLHFDLPAGIAGDMTLGALLDAGVPEQVVRDALALLPVDGYELTVARCLRKGLAGVDVKVVIHDHHDHDDHHHDHAHGRHGHMHDRGHAHRHYAEIKQLLERLPADVKRLALAMFEPVARAEAKLHGVAIDDVAFHEVGAIDSIVDFVGTAAAMAWLAPRAVTTSTIATGQGTIAAAHGLLPVPAPATLEILRESGLATTVGGSTHELTTPTGAAILAGLGARSGPAPDGVVLAVGYGAGDAELADRANLARVTVLEPQATAQGDEVVELTANLDDFNPEWSEHVAEQLFAAGALDVWWTPATMKKSRPAVILGVLCQPDALAACQRVILTETSTLGVRHARKQRTVLRRGHLTVDTPYGPVPVKLGFLDDGDVPCNVAPEHDACKALAQARGVPLKEIYAAALEAARRGSRR
jgi:uncharacterized protein (TIGR00299 family) protein